MASSPNRSEKSYAERHNAANKKYRSKVSAAKKQAQIRQAQRSPDLSKIIREALSK